MTIDNKIVHLSAREIMYITNSNFLSEPLMQVLISSANKNGESGVISVDRNSAEKLRDAFTDRLAKVGFDKDYDPTAEGRMLEDLIDRFFMP